jgi:hypothetical protein
MTPPNRTCLIPERLTPGDAEPVIVADFLRFSAGKPLSQLISARGEGHPVYRVDPVTDLARNGAYFSLAALAAGYADAFLQEAVACDRTMVVGYCSAAALALRIAAQLAGSRDVLAILVQPSWPDTTMIRSDFARFRADLGAANESCPDLEENPSRSLSQLGHLLHADLRAMATAHGLDESSSALAELLARYRAWLGFLLACRDALREPWSYKLSLNVLADAAGNALVPWFAPGSYQVTQLQPPDAEPVSGPDLARSVLAQIRNHAT